MHHEIGLKIMKLKNKREGKKMLYFFFVSVSIFMNF